MKTTTKQYIENFFEENTILKMCKSDVENCIDSLIAAYKGDGTVLTAGNGGSASDAEHIVGELMKGFLLKRKLEQENIDLLDTLPIKAEEKDYLIKHLQTPLRAYSLVSQTSLMTAFVNDVSADMVFAQQVLGYGNKGDVFIGLSTSGNSANIVNAALVAKAKGMITVGFTGLQDSKMSEICDITIKVPSSETYRIQEFHIQLYHLICACVENDFFGK